MSHFLFQIVQTILELNIAILYIYIYIFILECILMDAEYASVTVLMCSGLTGSV